MVGRVGFGGFVILWSKPNPTRHKKKFITQLNPPSLKNRPNLTGQVGLGRDWRVGGFFAHPYFVSSSSFFYISSTVNPLSLYLKCPSKHQLCTYMYAQSAIVLCYNDSTSLPFFSVQCLSLFLSKGFLFYFFLWEYDGRIETLNL